MPDKEWTTLFFNRSIPAHYHYVMYFSHFENGKWSAPQTLPFSGEYRDSDPVLSADGRTLYFVSDRPAQSLEPNHFHAWAADRTSAGWANLRPLQGPVNEKGNTEFVSFAANGNLYFTSDRSGSSFDVYRSCLLDGKYQSAENLGTFINDGRYTIEAFVALDETYVLLGAEFQWFDLTDVSVPLWSRRAQLSGGEQLMLSNEFYVPGDRPEFFLSLNLLGPDMQKLNAGHLDASTFEFPR